MVWYPGVIKCIKSRAPLNNKQKTVPFLILYFLCIYAFMHAISKVPDNLGYNKDKARLSTPNIKSGVFSYIVNSKIYSSWPLSTFNFNF